MKSIVALLFSIILLVGCGSTGSFPDAVANRRRPSPPPINGVWSVTSYDGAATKVTSGPSPALWNIAFPVLGSSYPACTYSVSCPTLSNVTESYFSALPAINAGHSITIKFKVTVTSGNPVFVYTLNANNTGTDPASVRLIIQLKNDDGTQAYGRWWGKAGYQVSPSSSEAVLTVPLTSDAWSSVYGESANNSAAALAGFKKALATPEAIGVVFGGGYFYGHGLATSNGAARFTLDSITIN